MRLYFAGPLFSEAERAFNLSLTHKLEALGFTVFLPQRDGVERDKPPYDTMPAEQRRQLIFKTDRDEVLKAHVFLYVLDGRVPDEGASVELGTAYAHKHLVKSEDALLSLLADLSSR